MQRFLATALMVALILSLSACSSPASPSPTATLAAQTASTPAATAAKAAGTTAPVAPAAAVGNLLTVADVEQVTGLTGVKLVPYDPSKGAGGDLNFADKDGNLILMANTNSVGKTTYAKMRDDKRYSLGAVSGIGDEGFLMMGPFSQTDPIGIAFIKGDKGISLNSYMDAVKSTKTVVLALSLDQMTQIAKLIASRM